MASRQSICAGTQLKSPSIIANAWEKRSDALSSAAVLLGIVGAKLGCHFLDPAAAILVAIYIAKFSIEQLIEAFKGLLDTALEPEVVGRIRASAEAVDGVLGTSAVRTREIGQLAWVDLEVLVRGDAPLGETAQIKQEVTRVVERGLERKARIVVYVKPAQQEGEV